MPERNPDEPSSTSGKTAPQHLPAGVKLLRTLEGHESPILSLAFDPSGERLASGGDDGTIKLWNVASGTLLHSLEAHEDVVYCVAFNPSGGILASGSGDKLIKIWNPATGKLRHTLKGHRGDVNGIVFQEKNVLMSASDDQVANLWDASKGKLLWKLTDFSNLLFGIALGPKTLKLALGTGDGTVQVGYPPSNAMRPLDGHQGVVWAVAFNPTASLLVSTGADGSIKVWDAFDEKLLRTLEGHTAHVYVAAFSPDGRLLASKSDDHTVRIWNCETWETIAIIPEPASTDNIVRALAFHPTQPWLAVGACTPGTDDGALIHFWELDYSVLLGEPSPQAIHHTTAKIVLVGDSGVGKTGLAWRLSHGEFKEHASTHGQQFWIMPQLGTLRGDGTECEAILWDLAGQPDYRLIHALFLNDADLALVLFDPTDTRDPLHGVEFWLKQFSEEASDGKETAPRCPIVLVAARADRGAPTLTDAELHEFCERRRLRGYLSTSARANEGVAELLEQMKALIPWDDKPATVTTTTFKQIKDFVLGLKQRTEGQPMIVSWEELRQQLVQTDAAWQFTDAEMKTAVGHLENYGYVRRLQTSKAEERVLLKPELLNNLAASFVLEARRNPSGLGSLEERRLLAGQYRFPELDGLPKAEQDLLIDAAALLFLRRHVAFREQTLDGQTYLVFPELINLKTPPTKDEGPFVEGTAYTVSGAVENVYASLVVLLGYTQMFTRRAQWKNQARYEVSGNAVCGFRQETERNGELDFVLYFGAGVAQPSRMLFQGLFESFLARRNLTVQRIEPVVCENQHSLNRSVVREKLAMKAEFAFCPDCGEKVKLPKTHEPIQLTRTQQDEVELQRRTADQRTRFEQAIFRVQAYVKDQQINAPGCFISYAWGDPAHERWVEKQLATDVQKAGMDVTLDRWHNAQIGASVTRFIERIEKCDRILMVGTPDYRRKYENKDSATGYVVASEVELINNRLVFGTESQKQSVLPLLREGEKTTSLPPLFHGRVHADFRDENHYFATAFDLILSLYQIQYNDPAVANLRETLRWAEGR